MGMIILVAFRRLTVRNPVRTEGLQMLIYVQFRFNDHFSSTKVSTTQKTENRHGVDRDGYLVVFRRLRVRNPVRTDDLEMLIYVQFRFNDHFSSTKVSTIKKTLKIDMA